MKARKMIKLSSSVTFHTRRPSAWSAATTSAREEGTRLQQPQQPIVIVINNLDIDVKRSCTIFGEGPC